MSGLAQICVRTSRIRWWSGCSGPLDKEIDYGEGSKSNAGFPPQPTWFEDNRHFSNIEAGLRQVGDAAVRKDYGRQLVPFL